MKQLSEKKVQELKQKHGEVYLLPVDDKAAYLRGPNMVDYKRAFSAMQEDGDIAFGEAMLEALFIDGDVAILRDDNYFLPARKKIVKFFNYDDPVIQELDAKTTQISIGDHKCIVRKINRADLKLAEKRNPSNKPFVTQEKLFEMVCIEKDDAFKDRNNASIRFPLFQAMEQMQNKKIASIKKL